MGSAGAFARNKKYGNPMKNKITAKKANTSEKARLGAIASHKNNRMKKGQASRMGKNSRKFENKIASKLPYDIIFLPNEICDRVAIFNNKVLFIEIKREGEKLRPKQQQFKDLVGDDYIVVRK